MITAGKHTVVPPIDHYNGIIVTIGNYTSIASGLKIYSGNHPCIEYPEVVSTYPFKEHGAEDYPPSKMLGSVNIGNDVWIATDVRILEGITIGDGAIVGAGSVVTKNVPDYAFVAGNPARIKRFRFGLEIRLKLKKIEWWNWSDEEVKEALPYLKTIGEFIEKYS